MVSELEAVPITLGAVPAFELIAERATPKLLEFMSVTERPARPQVSLAAP